MHVGGRKPALCDHESVGGGISDAGALRANLLCAGRHGEPDQGTVPRPESGADQHPLCAQQSTADGLLHSRLPADASLAKPGSEGDGDGDGDLRDHSAEASEGRRGGEAQLPAFVSLHQRGLSISRALETGGQSPLKFWIWVTPYWFPESSRLNGLSL